MADSGFGFKAQIWDERSEIHLLHDSKLTPVNLSI